MDCTDCIERVLSFCDATTIARAACCDKALREICRPMLAKKVEDLRVLCESAWRAATVCIYEDLDDEADVHKAFWLTMRVCGSHEREWVIPEDPAGRPVLDDVVFMDAHDTSLVRFDFDGVPVTMALRCPLLPKAQRKLEVSAACWEWKLPPGHGLDSSPGGRLAEGVILQGLLLLDDGTLPAIWRHMALKRTDALRDCRASAQERFVADALQRAYDKVRNCTTCAECGKPDVDWVDFDSFARCCSEECCHECSVPYTLPQEALMDDWATRRRLGD